MAALEHRDAERSARRSFQEETHMKWMILAAVAALSLAVLAPSQAAEPQPIRQASYAGSNWWARYGSGPVAQPEAMPVPVTVEPEAVSMPHGGYGYDYIYYPGICDYTPPCIDWLWAGYAPNPCRCHPHFMQAKCRAGNGSLRHGRLRWRELRYRQLGQCDCGLASAAMATVAMRHGGCGNCGGCTARFRTTPLAAPKPPADQGRPPAWASRGFYPSAAAGRAKFAQSESTSRRGSVTEPAACFVWQTPGGSAQSVTRVALPSPCKNG